jgi:2-dehydropantoate 2-reductase
VRYVIVGAGGIGGAIGGRLADTGHDVVLVARGSNAEALRTNGLRLALPDRVIVAHLPVVEEVGRLTLQPDDVLLLTAQSQDTAGLLAALAVLPVATTTSTAGQLLPLICAQNGTSNEREALRLFTYVHGMNVVLSATRLAPGRVAAEGWPVTGVLELGRYPTGSDDHDVAVAADLTASGFIVDVREDVMQWKRTKLLGNLNNALQAMCGPDLSPEDDAVVAGVRRQAVDEARACFAAAGQSIIGPDEWDARRAAVSSRPVEGEERAGSSTWQSITRGAGAVETDYLNGEIVLLGRLHAIPTPTNEHIQHTMWRFVRDNRPAGSLAATELLTRH